jgi:hypothetical protein
LSRQKLQPLSVSENEVGGAPEPGALSGPESPSDHESHAVQPLANYVYGTISTLVAIAGLTFESNPGALTTAGVVVVGAVAIWFAHSLSHVVTTSSWQHLQLRRTDVVHQLRTSWAILLAAFPATIVFVLSGIHLFEVRTAFVVADVVGVLALAVVGIGTTGGKGISLVRRTVYVTALVLVGVTIVLLEAAVHLL